MQLLQALELWLSSYFRLWWYMQSRLRTCTQGCRLAGILCIGIAEAREIVHHKLNSKAGPQDSSGSLAQDGTC